jgi:hypothetical protein
MNFFDYFTHHEAHPMDIPINPLPLGTVYEYVGSQFLNGLVPYVKPVRAWVVNRYLAANDEYPGELTVSFSGIDMSIQDILKTTTPTKAQVISILNEPACVVTPRYDVDFQDDLVFLAIVPEKKKHCKGKMWYYFWYDRDCSDCCIGRFRSTDSEENIFKSFDEFVLESNQMGKPDHIDINDPPFLINLSYFNWWSIGESS